jgi:hypothetical protein
MSNTTIHEFMPQHWYNLVSVQREETICVIDERYTIQLLSAGLGKTVIVDDVVTILFGAVYLTQTVAEIFCLVADEFVTSPKLSTLKLVRQCLPDVVRYDMGCRRMQAAIKMSRPERARFAAFMGLKFEGIMKGYGPTGEDYALYGLAL